MAGGKAVYRRGIFLGDIAAAIYLAGKRNDEEGERV